MVTGGTLNKTPFFNTSARLNLVLGLLFTCAQEFQWTLQAWAILANHYHFIALSPEDPRNLSRMLRKFHARVAMMINREDGIPGRKIIYQFWDTYIDRESSYWARLNYVHNNPVKHGMAETAVKHPWCSAGWFEQRADTAFFRAVSSFNTDRVKVMDDF